MNSIELVKVETLVICVCKGNTINQRLVFTVFTSFNSMLILDLIAQRTLVKPKFYVPQMANKHSYDG